jgi:hypothetical protein
MSQSEARCESSGVESLLGFVNIERISPAPPSQQTAAWRWADSRAQEFWDTAGSSARPADRTVLQARKKSLCFFTSARGRSYALTVVFTPEGQPSIGLGPRGVDAATARSAGGGPAGAAGDRHASDENQPTRRSAVIDERPARQPEQAREMPTDGSRPSAKLLRGDGGQGGATSAAR